MTNDTPLPHEGPSGLPEGTPEYLTMGSGTPLAPEAGRPKRSGARVALLGGAAVGGLALVGAGAWAAITLAGGGPQPAEGLPAGTVAYLSIDLDPSASQKLEAMEMLNKFPAFKDEVGLDAKDDLRRALYDRIQEDADCKNISYADDIEPWLGDRAAVAAIDAGKGKVDPVLVIQVRDEKAAEKGMTKIRNCGNTGDADEADEASGSGDWVIANGWAVVAETEAIAQSAVDDAEKASLADDETYQKWVDEVGDPGIVTMYAAPQAGQLMTDLAEQAQSMQGLYTGDGGLINDSADPAQDQTELVSDFKGAAGTLRFSDGSLELEVAGQAGGIVEQIYDTQHGADAIATLPDDTAAALGVGLSKGWLTAYADQMVKMAGEDTTVEDLFDQMSESTGMDVPEDVETLTGESMTLAIGSDFDLDAASNSDDGSDVPIALKVQGDPAAIDKVLEKMRDQMGSDATILTSDTEGDMIVVGPNSDYRAEVLKKGTLGDSKVFGEVVREADNAGALFFVNFDAGDGWLVSLADDDQELADNLEPLSALGMSSWLEGDAGHFMLRLTTD